MAVTKSQARLFAQLIAALEPEIKRGFMASVTDLSAQVDWRRLLENLEAGNIDGAIAALNISPAAWSQYSASVTSAYAASGSAYAAQIQQAGIGSIGTRFNMTNPRAEAWIRENVGGSITVFVREQIEVARNVIEEGYAAGKGPRNIGTDLVGRTTGPSGSRQGGVLGLDAPRANRLRKVVDGMQTPEGVQSLVIKHQNGSLSLRYKVNKSTANRILSAYRKGEAVPEAQRLTSERQYRNALLQARGDTVAQTETANAVLNARDEQWRQLAESEGIQDSQIIKTWRHGRGPSANHRPDHLAMAGHSVRGIETPFEFPDGGRLRFAHDPMGGARHIINCGCSTEYRIDRTGGL